MREYQLFRIETFIRKNAILSLLSVLVILTGCSSMNKAAVNSSPVRNEIHTISRSGKPDRQKIIYINSQVEILTDDQEMAWREKHLPEILSKVGIADYRILAPTQNTLRKSDIEDSYLLVFTIDNSTYIRGRSNSPGSLYVPATLSIFELPEKKEFLRLSGESYNRKYDIQKLSVDEMVRSVFESMLYEAYLGYRSLTFLPRR